MDYLNENANDSHLSFLLTEFMQTKTLTRMILDKTQLRVKTTI